MGRLTFGPARVQARQRVSVSYEPASTFRHDSVVVLRGVFRAPVDWMRGQPTLTVMEAARLRRGRDGRFHGAFVFPPHASLGRFAVGSLDSLRADGNGGRHWALLAHAADGRPTAGALASAAWDEMLRNDWDRALTLAEQLTTLYPDDPGSWLYRSALEPTVVGEARFAARRPAYVARLAHFDSVTTARGDGDRLGYLFWLAFQLRDSARASHWRGRLVAESPLHPLAVQERMDDLVGALRGRPSARLDSLEVIWSAAGPVHLALFKSGLGAARSAKDTAAVRRWSDRARRAGIHDDVDVANELARIPAFVPEALHRLAAARDSLDRERGHRLRDVDATLAEVRREVPARRRDILTAMASASLSLGDTTAALAHYHEGAAQGWSPTIFRAARTLAHARGDSAVERHWSALLAADPLSSGATRDSLRAADPSLVSDSAWAAHLAAGEAELTRRVTLEPPSIDASRSIRLAAWGTTATAPRSLARGRPTVVALWSMGCPYSSPHLPTLARMDSVLTRRGIDLLVVTRDEPSEHLTAFVSSQRAAPPIHHDLENTVGRTFAAYGYPWYFVLDGHGRLVAKGHDITTVAAEAVAVARHEQQ